MAPQQPPSRNPRQTAERIALGLEIDWDSLTDELAFVLGPVAEEAGREAILGAGEDAFSVIDAFAIDYAKRRGAELVGRRVLSDGTVIDNPRPEFAITESTRDMIKEKLVSAIEQGWSAHNLRNEIMDDAFGVKRALVISRTETAFAHNRGQLEGARVAGQEFKSWLTGGGCCDDCDDNSAQGPIDINEDFNSGDDAPPAHPNCRCSLVYLTGPEVTEEEGGPDTIEDEDNGE